MITTTHIKVGSFDFHLELDTSPAWREMPFVCWIYFEGKPFVFGEKQQTFHVYKRFNQKVVDKYFKNFCFKFATDEAYRNSYNPYL